MWRSRPPEQIHTSNSPREPDDVFVRCVEQHRSAVITVANAAAVFEGNFTRADGTSLTIEVARPRLSAVFRARTLCMVSFGEGTKTHGFLSNVRETDDADGRTAITMERPPRVMALDCRMTYRVPVMPKSGLKVNMITRGRQRWAAEAVDVSLLGIQLRLPKSQSPKLDAGEAVEIELEMHGEPMMSVQAELRREELGKSEVRYGLLYPSALQRGELNPPSALRAIVARLERRWIQERLA
jgi:hypothetical protein